MRVDGGRERVDSGRDRGFILPLVILLLPAFTALAFSAFVLAHGQLLAARLDLRLLEATSAANPPPGILPAPGEEVAELGAGFMLLTSPAPAVASHRRGLRLAWRFEAGRVAGDWARNPQGEPRLGPLTLADLAVHLLRRGLPLEPADAMGVGFGEILPGGSPVPEEGLAEGGIVLQAPHGLAARNGDGTLLVLAPGEVRLTGQGELTGVILSGEGVYLGAGVIWRGAARSHGSPPPSGEGTLVPDSLAIRGVLGWAFGDGWLPVPGGERLGRH